jgi:hypothetical protein
MAEPIEVDVVMYIGGIAALIVGIVFFVALMVFFYRKSIQTLTEQTNAKRLIQANGASPLGLGADGGATSVIIRSS